MKYLLICSCFNMEKKAKEAFSLKFPGESFPQVVKGRDRISKMAQQLGNDHLRAIGKLGGRFAYYVNIDDGKIIEEYDLMRGTRLA